MIEITDAVVERACIAANKKAQQLEKDVIIPSWEELPEEEKEFTKEIVRTILRTVLAEAE